MFFWRQVSQLFCSYVTIYAGFIITSSVTRRGSCRLAERPGIHIQMKSSVPATRGSANSRGEFFIRFPPGFPSLLSSPPFFFSAVGEAGVPAATPARAGWAPCRAVRRSPPRPARPLPPRPLWDLLCRPLHKAGGHRTPAVTSVGAVSFWQTVICVTCIPHGK